MKRYLRIRTCQLAVIREKELFRIRNSEKRPEFNKIYFNGEADNL
jgi:hypothetical protein